MYKKTHVVFFIFHSDGSGSNFPSHERGRVAVFLNFRVPSGFEYLFFLPSGFGYLFNTHESGTGYLSMKKAPENEKFLANFIYIYTCRQCMLLQALIILRKLHYLIQHYIFNVQKILLSKNCLKFGDFRDDFVFFTTRKILTSRVPGIYQ